MEHTGKNKKKKKSIQHSSSVDKEIDLLKQKLALTASADRKILESKALLAAYTHILSAFHQYQNYEPNAKRYILKIDHDAYQLFNQIMRQDDNTLKKFDQQFATLMEEKLVINRQSDNSSNSTSNIEIPVVNVVLKINIKTQKRPLIECQTIAGLILNGLLGNLEKFPKYVDKQTIICTLLVVMKAQRACMEDTADLDLLRDIQSEIGPVMTCLNHLPRERLLSRDQVKDDLIKPFAYIYQLAQKRIHIKKVASAAKTLTVSTGENLKIDGNKDQRKKRANRKQ